MRHLFTGRLIARLAGTRLDGGSLYYTTSFFDASAGPLLLNVNVEEVEVFTLTIAP